MKIPLAVILILVAFSIKAQKTDWSADAHLNFQSFRGNAVVKYTFVNVGNNDKQGYSNDRFGKIASAAPGIGISMRHATKPGILLGFDTGMDLMTNAIKIDYIYLNFGRVPASGKVRFKSFSYHLTPLAGYRFKLKNGWSADIYGSFGFNFPLGPRKGTGKAESEDGSMKVKILNLSEAHPFDPMPGAGLSINFQKYSGYVSWNAGKMDYQAKYIGSIADAYARLIRVGCRYNLNAPNKKPAVMK